MKRIKRLFTGSLRNKLIFTTVLVAVLALLIVAGYAIWVTTTALRAQATREQLVKLDTLAQGVSNFLAGLEQDALFLSQSPTVSQYLAAEAADSGQSAALSALQQEFLAFAQARQIYDQVRFLDAAGNEIVRVNTSPDGFSYVVTPDKLQNKADRYYFTDSMAVRPGQVFISPLDLNVEQGQIELLPDGSNKPVIRYGTPVLYNGSVAGVIVTNVLAKNFLNMLRSSSAVVYLADDDGYYLYHPDEAKRWGRDLGTDITIFDDFSGETASLLLSDDAGDTTEAGNFISHRPLSVPGYEQITWYLGYVESQSTVLAPVFSFIRGAVVVAVLALVVAVLAAIGINRVITRPIIELEQAAAKVSAGDFNVQITPQTQDEIGTLTEAFISMTSQLKSLVEGLEDKIAERTQAIETTANISRKLTTILDLDELLQEVVTQLQKTLELYHVHIYLRNESTGELIMAEGSGLVGQQLKSRGHKLQPGQGIVGRVAQSGEPFLAADVNIVPNFIRNPLLPNTQSELALPLRKGDQILGVLDMQSEETGRFTTETVYLMQSIADQVAIAADNARLFQRAQEGAATALELNRQLTQQSWGHLRNIGASGYIFSAGQTTPTNSEWLPVMTRAVKEKSPVQNGGSVDSPGPAAIAIPLLLRDEIIGVIALERAEDEGWSEDELITLENVTNQVALALESARLSYETERSAWRDQVVSESTAKVWSSAEIEEVMRTAVAQLGDKLQASEVVIRLGTDEDFLSD